MVEAGRITREQMEERLAAMRKSMDGPSEKIDSLTREQYAEAAAKMKKAVEAGEMTVEQMKERLAAMRKLLSD